MRNKHKRIYRNWFTYRKRQSVEFSCIIFEYKVLLTKKKKKNGCFINRYEILTLKINRKISADTDLSSVIYATDTIIPVSNQVIGALKDTKQDVASILEQVKKDKQGIQTDLVLQYTSKFESAKRALYLTRLLHGYARTLGNSANKGKWKNNLLLLYFGTYFIKLST